MKKKNVFQPDVEILFRQEPMTLEQIKDLLGPESTLCFERECEPPYGGREDCEFYQDGTCLANSHKSDLMD